MQLMVLNAAFPHHLMQALEDIRLFMIHQTTELPSHQYEPSPNSVNPSKEPVHPPTFPSYQNFVPSPCTAGSGLFKSHLLCFLVTILPITGSSGNLSLSLHSPLPLLALPPSMANVELALPLISILTGSLYSLPNALPPPPLLSLSILTAPNASAPPLPLRARPNPAATCDNPSIILPRSIDVKSSSPEMGRLPRPELMQLLRPELISIPLSLDLRLASEKRCRRVMHSFCSSRATLTSAHWVRRWISASTQYIGVK